MNQRKTDTPKHIYYGLIPARSGSKGLINKNIKNFNGKPLMSWSICSSNKSKHISRTFVSTDSKEYSDIAEEYGAEVLRLRPLSLSDDLSTDYECIDDFIKQLQENNIRLPHGIVQLRPTFPNRGNNIIDDMILEFDNNWSGYDSFRTVIPVEKTPFKMYTIQHNYLKPVVMKLGSLNEPFNQPRQILPKAYLHNGCVDIIKTDTIVRKHSVTGDVIYPYVMHELENDDIDTHNDFDKALLKSRSYYEEKNDEIDQDNKYYDYEDEKSREDSPDGLSPDGLSPDGLSPDGLSPDGLSKSSTGKLPNIDIDKSDEIDLNATVRTLRIDVNHNKNNFSEDDIISAKSAEVREGSSTHKS